MINKPPEFFSQYRDNQATLIQPLRSGEFMANRLVHFFKSLGLSLLTAGLLASCGGGDDSSSAASPTAGSGTGSGYPNSPASCSVDGQRAWLRDYMNDEYFWYDKQGVPNAAAKTMDEYLDSLLNKPIDRYSFAESTVVSNQFFVEGTRTGYGYSLGWADTAQTVLKVRLIEPLSPLGLGNLLKRGDTIISIDGFTPAQVFNGQPGAAGGEGVPRSFVVANDVGTQRTFTVNSRTFKLSPVITSQVLTAANGDKVGYLLYEEFIATGEAALGVAFNSFRAAGVKHVILDFRYNGGGSTAQARNIASMVGGSGLNGRVFAQFRFSAKKSAENFNQLFRSTGLPATALEGVDKVMVITSGSTASASELVINALKPFKNVLTVGSTSFGKPFAFLPRSACEIEYNAVNLDIANAVGFADYTSGFAPTCAVADDFSRQLGDPAEGRTAAALAYIATGQCPAPSGQAKPAAVAAQQAATLKRLDLGAGETSPRRARID
jgi:carboxyl-terminal processing protease